MKTKRKWVMMLKIIMATSDEADDHLDNEDHDKGEHDL